MLVNGFPIHAASFGMPLPDAVNDIKKNRELILLISELEEKTDVLLNEDYIGHRLDLLSVLNGQLGEYDFDEAFSNYKKSFEIMASKGFYSYDIDIEPYLHEEGYYNLIEKNVSYKLIAKPIHKLNLPQSIIKRLPMIEIKDFNIENPLFLIDLNKAWNNKR